MTIVVICGVKEVVDLAENIMGLIESGAVRVVLSRQTHLIITVSEDRVHQM
jgi:hypothetical protein